MARLLKMNGEVQNFTPKNGKSFTLDELYIHIGCRIVERILLDSEQIMWVDEEGKFGKDLSVNYNATREYQNTYGAIDVIVGNALITSENEVN